MYAQYVDRKTMDISPWRWLPCETWFPTVVVHHLKRELELLDGFIASGTKRLHEVTILPVLFIACHVSCLTIRLSSSAHRTL